MAKKHMKKCSTSLIIQFSSVAQSCLTLRPHESARQASLSITNSWSSLRLTSIKLMMPSSHLSSVVPSSSCPQPLPASGSFPMSQLFAWGSQSIGFSFSISPSSEHPGLISFSMDWLDLLVVQGTLQKSSPTPQFKSINFFGTQLSSQSNSHIPTWSLEKP